MKINEFYKTATQTRLLSRWNTKKEVSKVVAREEAVLALNSSGADRETVLQATVAAREDEIAYLKRALQEATTTIEEQKAKLAENELVMMERVELQSELRSTASSGAELVGDISAKLSDVVMALQSQGLLFHTKLNDTPATVPGTPAAP